MGNDNYKLQPLINPENHAVYFKCLFLNSKCKTTSIRKHSNVQGKLNCSLTTYNCVTKTDRLESGLWNFKVKRIPAESAVTELN